MKVKVKIFLGSRFIQCTSWLSPTSPWDEYLKRDGRIANTKKWKRRRSHLATTVCESVRENPSENC